MPADTHPTLGARTLLFVLLGASPAIGCAADEDADGSDAPPAEPDSWDELLEPVPGSRLRPIVRVAEDGTRVHVGWHDTLFDTPCEFTETSGAGLRCVPTTSGEEPWLYADADCTEPVIQDIWIPEGATMVRARGDGCFDGRYFEVGEPVTEIYYDANGPCEVFSNDPSHRVVAVAHDQFVGATAAPAEGNGRIVPLVLTAEDGARQIFGAWDREHEEEVTPAPDDAGQLRWFGRREPRVSTIYYADADCTVRVAVAECVPDSESPRTAREVEAGYCGALVGRYELLESVDRLHAMRSDGRCVPEDLPTGYGATAWRVGASLDDAAFAESSASDDGGGRLRHDVYTNPEGEPLLPSGRLYDAQMDGAECRWEDPLTYSSEPTTGGATFECVPRDAAILDRRYVDAECTEPTAYRWVFEESCASEPLYAYGAGVAAAVLGPIASEGGYSLDDEGTCVATSPSDPPDGDDEGEHYVVEGATIELAHATDVIE